MFQERNPMKGTIPVSGLSFLFQKPMSVMQSSILVSLLGFLFLVSNGKFDTGIAFGIPFLSF